MNNPTATHVLYVTIPVPIEATPDTTPQDAVRMALQGIREGLTGGVVSAVAVSHIKVVPLRHGLHAVPSPELFDQDAPINYILTDKAYDNLTEGDDYA
jgi:hypothetical protein